MSMPVAYRLVRIQATPVVPLPMKQSSTLPPCGLLARTMRSISSTGFCVGCSVRSACLSSTQGKRQMFEGFLKKYSRPLYSRTFSS